MERIVVLTTGGTIGGEAVEAVRRPPQTMPMPRENKDYVSTVLAEDFSSFPTRCLTLEPRDSKHIDTPYREKLVEHVIKAPEDRVLITHGTDALIETADFFHFQKSLLPVLDKKTIILTGAMVPLANGPLSDGYLNLEYALRLLAQDEGQLSPLGIVLCGYETLESTSGDWQPRYYTFLPGCYEKFYHPTDSRLSGLKKRGTLRSTG